MRSVIFVYKKKKNLPFVRPCSYIVSNVNMLLSEPAAEQEDRTNVTYLSIQQQCRWVHSFIASWRCEFILLSS